MKDTICKEYKYEDVIPFHLEIISKDNMDFFIPISYQAIDKDSLRVCYDVSEVDPMGQDVQFDEAPYIASSLIRGMRSVMDRYIFPSQFLLKEKVVYITNDGRIRIAYVPIVTSGIPPKDPGKIMRKKTFELLNEVYGIRYMEKNVLSKEYILKGTLDVLLDSSTGMDTCLRRIEKLKEETFYHQNTVNPQMLDLKGNFV